MSRALLATCEPLVTCEHGGHAVPRGLRATFAGAEEVLASRFEIEIAGERFAAEASLKPLHDPAARRVRM